MQDILEALSSQLYFSSFDWLVFATNVVLFLFARPIIGAFRTERGGASIETRVRALRILNLILFLLYFCAALVLSNARKISQTGLTLLVAFLVLHFVNHFIVARFGRVRTIEGKKYHAETYQSEVFALLALLLIATATFLEIVNIWDLTGWLQTTSVIGGLLVVVFSTREAWAPDNVNGLILLYNGDVTPGAVVRVRELELLAIAIQTSLTQTTFKDLTQRHRIVIPNSRFRSAKIEVLSEASAGGLWQFAEFNLAYGLDGAVVDGFLRDIWGRAHGQEKAINADVAPRIRIADNGDHAVRWRLFYMVSNPYRILLAGYAINRAAYDLSLERGIGLNTPLTHTAIDAEAPTVARRDGAIAAALADPGPPAPPDPGSGAG